MLAAALWRRGAPRCPALAPRPLSSRPLAPPARPTLDWAFLSDPANTAAMERNVALRRSRADVRLVQELYKEIHLHTDIHDMKSEAGRAAVEARLLAAGLALPNMCPEHVMAMGDHNTTIFEKPFTNPGFKVKKFEDIARILSGARLANLGVVSGERSYYLTRGLAELEQALVHWTVDQLLLRGFSLLSVPDLLPPAVVAACGMAVEGERTQVYRLAAEQGGAALSGTAEMAIGGWLAGRRLEQLPRRLAAVSRCYRAETGGARGEGGLYRVHQFTKVEMFVVTEGRLEASEAALEEVLGVQRELFAALGLAHRVLAMCAEELGDPAYRKYDIEAWLPGRALEGVEGWGEISSCSSCTDYQARRLGLTGAGGAFAHTVNGTACAVPRMVIALCEQLQEASGAVRVPEALQPYLRGQQALEPLPRKQRPQFSWMPGANYLQGRE